MQITLTQKGCAIVATSENFSQPEHEKCQSAIPWLQLRKNEKVLSDTKELSGSKFNSWLLCSMLLFIGCCGREKQGSLKTAKAIMTTKLSAPHFQDFLHQLQNLLFMDPPSAWSRLSGSSVQTSESSPKRVLHLRVEDRGPSQCSGVHRSVFCVQGCETDPTTTSHCNVAQHNSRRHLLPLS